MEAERYLAEQEAKKHLVIHFEEAGALNEGRGPREQSRMSLRVHGRCSTARSRFIIISNELTDATVRYSYVYVKAFQSRLATHKSALFKLCTVQKLEPPVGHVSFFVCTSGRKNNACIFMYTYVYVNSFHIHIK